MNSNTQQQTAQMPPVSKQQAQRQRGQIIHSTAIGLLKLGFTPQQVAFCIKRQRARRAKQQAVQP